MATPSNILTDVLDRRTLAKIQGKVVKQGKRNPLHRFVLSKSDQGKIAAWNRDHTRLLEVFNVRSVDSFGIHKLRSTISDRAGDRYQHDGCGYPRGDVYGTGRCIWPKPLGRCD